MGGVKKGTAPNSTEGIDGGIAQSQASLNIFYSRSDILFCDAVPSPNMLETETRICGVLKTVNNGINTKMRTGIFFYQKDSANKELKGKFVGIEILNAWLYPAIDFVIVETV